MRESDTTPPPTSLTVRDVREALAPQPIPAADLALPPEVQERAREAARGAWAEGTQDDYRRAFAAFQRWCEGQGRQARPAAPATVVAYLLARADAGVSFAALTLDRAAISWVHQGTGENPTRSEEVRMVMKGLRREKGTRPKAAKRPVTLDLLARLVARIDRTTLRGKRDAAIILVGWNAALRRSEIVGIDREHLSDQEGGAGILLPRSKTDQSGEGYVVGIPQRDDDVNLCPVRALAEWLKASGITTGPIFRPLTRHGLLSPQRLAPGSVADLVKAYAGAAGLPPEPFAGHSLRAGLVTESYRQGVPEAQIMGTTRHKSATMLARYRREANPVAQGAAGALRRKKP